MKFVKNFQNSLVIFFFSFKEVHQVFPPLIEVFACCHENQVSWSITSIGLFEFILIFG